MISVIVVLCHFTAVAMDVGAFADAEGESAHFPYLHACSFALLRFVVWIVLDDDDSLEYATDADDLFGSQLCPIG